VSELEEELERVCAQLSEAETALAEAEADVRDEIVGEIQVGWRGSCAVCYDAPSALVLARCVHDEG
jgi:hypothetical protein